MFSVTAIKIMIGMTISMLFEKNLSNLNKNLLKSCTTGEIRLVATTVLKNRQILQYFEYLPFLQNCETPSHSFLKLENNPEIATLSLICGLKLTHHHLNREVSVKLRKAV